MVLSNRILKRHSQYLINQWWTGQLSEHNAENVFLSDIDWRSSFIKIEKSTALNSSFSDVLLDFPDADQHYNPRRRRWLLTKGHWDFWVNFEKVYSEQIIKHIVLETIIKTYTYLFNNSELLDYVTSKFMSLGFSFTNQKNFEIYNTTLIPESIQELHYINLFKKF